MKISVKIITFFTILFFFSCSSDSSSNSGEGGGSQTLVYPIRVEVDGSIYDQRTVEGDNLSNPSGGSFGIDYQLLYAYFDNSITGRIPVVNKKIETYIAIPKNDITEGEHLFSNVIQADGYFAKIAIKIDNVQQVCNTTSGKVTVTDFDPVTNIVQGTFELITNDGTIQNHTVSGSFKYKLVE